MPCLDCGRPRVSGRCTDCRRGLDRARGTRRERGYGAEHDRLRAEWAPRVEAGEVDCWRCGVRIDAGATWHLGHDDDDRAVTRGPEHEACNLSAAGRARWRR